MAFRSLQEHFEAQTNDRRQDPGTSCGVPVAFLLSEFADFEFFKRGMQVLGGEVLPLMQYPTTDVVTISYPNRPKEIWVHARKDGYLELYNKFCRTELGIELPNSYRKEGFAVDHAYSRSSIREDIDAYIRLFLVKSRPNSSWGAYYEQRLKTLFIGRGRVGLRKETVAIRAKITGITAPLKGNTNERNLANVAAVVTQLVDLGMTTQDEFETDFQSLVAFCGMADGDFIGMTASIDSEGRVRVVPHPKVK